MTEKQGMINLSRNGSKSYAFVIFSDSDVAFLQERKDATFCWFLYSFYFIHSVAKLKNNFLSSILQVVSRQIFVFHTSGGMSSRLAALIVFRIASRASSVKCSNLMSGLLLIISSICLSMISRGLASRYLKCLFHFWSLFSWLATFSFDLAVLFLPLTLFAVCHAN